MKVSLDREGKNVVRVGLELEAERASRAYEVTCRELSNQVEIPGFRKGKAPRNIIEKRFGRDAIKQEALERLLPELLHQVITDENLDIITRPEIVECNFELGEPLKLAAKFEVRPEVKLGEYKGLKIDVPEAVMPEDALDTALANIASQRASMQAIDDREVAMGDHLLLDFECFVDDKLIEGGQAEGLTLEVKEGAFVPGFCEQLVGKKPKEKFEVEVTFPDEYRNEKLAGKLAKFKVEIKELREKVVPEIDDEFAKSLEHESLEELKKVIQERMTEEISMENEARSQRLVVEAVVEQSELDIPETMIAREHELLMHQIREIVETNGQSWEEYQGMEEFKQLDGAKLKEANQRVLHSLVLGAVVKAENLNVTYEEVAPYVVDYAARNQFPDDRIKELFSDEMFMRQVSEEVLTSKVVDFLVKTAQLNYVPDTHEGHGHDHDHGEGCAHDHEPEKEKVKAKSSESKAADSAQEDKPKKAVKAKKAETK